jgi:hypothetical protein
VPKRNFPGNGRKPVLKEKYAENKSVSSQNSSIFSINLPKDIWNFEKTLLADSALPRESSKKESACLS